MKTYRGKGIPGGATVTVDDGRNTQNLQPRFDLRGYTEPGFAYTWGNASSGASQLALALLADHCQDDQRALTLHQRFKLRVVARLPAEEWELTSAQIDEKIRELTGVPTPPTPEQRTPLHQSPTWPIVGAFAIVMEHTLDRPENRVKGNRDEWVKADPYDCIAQAERNLERMRGLIAQRGAGGQVDDEELLRRAANAANLTMIAIDAMGLLILNEEQKLTTLERAQRGAAKTGEVVALVSMGVIDDYRTLLGAQKSQDPAQAVEGYTNRVREGCAAAALAWWGDKNEGMGDLPGPASGVLAERIRKAEPIPAVQPTEIDEQGVEAARAWVKS